MWSMLYSRAQRVTWLCFQLSETEESSDEEQQLAFATKVTDTFSQVSKKLSNNLLTGESAVTIETPKVGCVRMLPWCIYMFYAFADSCASRTRCELNWAARRKSLACVCTKSFTRCGYFHASVSSYMMSYMSVSCFAQHMWERSACSSEIMNFVNNKQDLKSQEHRWST